MEEDRRKHEEALLGGGKGLNGPWFGGIDGSDNRGRPREKSCRSSKIGKVHTTRRSDDQLPEQPRSRTDPEGTLEPPTG